jgi:hypothetical protein
MVRDVNPGRRYACPGLLSCARTGRRNHFVLITPPRVPPADQVSNGTVFGEESDLFENKLSGVFGDIGRIAVHREQATNASRTNPTRKRGRPSRARNSCVPRSRARRLRVRRLRVPRVPRLHVGFVLIPIGVLAVADV